jgi:hypothetical protein
MPIMGSPQIRLGNIVVRDLGNRRFAFRDALDPTQVQMLDDVDVPELITFLYERSESAKKLMRLDYLSTPAGPHQTGPAGQ